MGAASSTLTLGSTTLRSDVIPAMVVATTAGNLAESVVLFSGGSRACGAIDLLLSAVMDVEVDVMDVTAP